MPQFLIAIHHPDDYDPSVSEDKKMHEDIDKLNDEMVAKGIRVFVGGLHPATNAKTLLAQSNGEVSVTDGPFLKTNEHMGGFWVLECKDIDEAIEWGSKAVKACRTQVEVRAFHQI